MLELLEKFINEHRLDLFKPELWKTLKVDYHHPYVHRLYQDIDGNRYYLHMIKNSNGEKCLFHKHKWESAIYIAQGKYEMGVSYDESDKMVDENYELPLAAKMILSTGSAYEMSERHGLHYVKPISEYSLSIMVSGKIYDKNIKETKGGKQLSELSEEEKQEVLNLFRANWPIQVKLS